MLDLTKLDKGKNIRPPRVVLYGTSGIGKSTFASKAPNVVFMDIEDGLDNLDVASFKVKTFKEVMEGIEALYTQDHDFTTLAVDSIDWLEQLIFDQVAQEHNVKNIEDFGYGKGYSFAVNLWQQFLDGLTALRNEKSIAVILLAHDQIKRYDDPMTESYDRHTLKLHAKSAALVSEWADCLLFAGHRVFVKEQDTGFNKKIAKGKGGDRILYTEESPAFIAKNRYGLSRELPVCWDTFIGDFTKATTAKKEK